MSNHVMQPETQEKLDAYTAEIGKINGAKNVAQTFNVTPSVAQSLELRVQETSHFLSLINIVQVDEEAGEKIGVGVANQPLAYRVASNNPASGVPRRVQRHEVARRSDCDGFDRLPLPEDRR